MSTENNRSGLGGKICAAFIFLTRLPLWRLHQPSKDAYTHIVEFWPITGWLTAGISAAMLYFITPYNVIIAVLAAIAARLLLTGALHEDGLADFFDGFGGGNSKERILAIMKDSHIGTYGVLGIIFYILTLGTSLFSLASFSPKITALIILMADPFAKLLASQTIMLMPYARKEEDSKAHNIYCKFSLGSYLFLLLQGLLPIGLFIWLAKPTTLQILLLIAVPVILCALLNTYIYKKIKGYTGDCNGAIFLLCELSAYLTAVFAIIQQ